jgi:alkaline phosphatase
LQTLIVVTADHSHTLTIMGYPKRGSDIRGMTGKSGTDGLPEPILSYANGPGKKFKHYKIQVTFIKFYLHGKLVTFPIVAEN